MTNDQLTELVTRARQDGGYMGAVCADAIEALVAERDQIAKERQGFKDVAEHLQRERDAIAKLCADGLLPEPAFHLCGDGHWVTDADKSLRPDQFRFKHPAFSSDQLATILAALVAERDRHDVEDWPEASKQAFAKMKELLP